MPLYMILLILIVLLCVMLTWRWWMRRRKMVASQQTNEQDADSGIQAARKYGNFEQDPLSQLNQALFRRLYTKLMLAGFVPITSVDELAGSRQRHQTQMLSSMRTAFSKEPKVCLEIVAAILPEDTATNRQFKVELIESIQAVQ